MTDSRFTGKAVIGRSRLRKQKIPAPFDVGMPYFILNSDPRPLSARVITIRTACGQVFWLPDRPPAASSHPLRIVTSSGLCPRLQRRDRDGLTPSSLSPGWATRRNMISFYYSPLRLSRGISVTTPDSSLLPFSPMVFLLNSSKCLTDRKIFLFVKIFP